MLPPVRVVLSVVVAVAVCAVVAAGDALAEATAELVLGIAQSTVETAGELARDGAGRFARWVENGYARRPAVMIGLAGVLLLPPLVLIGAVLHLWQARKDGEPAEPGLDAADHAAAAPRARIEIEGDGAIELPAGRDLVQIGGQDDNDIRIEGEGVERYHAIIARIGGSGFTITDVSGPDGEGLRVNGERRASAPLAHGDTVELGRARLRFATAA